MADSPLVSDVVPPSDDIEDGAPSSELHTFLFADVRGYTRFTQERGDEAAAQLVGKFVSVIREVVGAKGGQLLELRGDEALVVFSSARQALRAAVDLQARFVRESERDPSLPLPVGIGLDAGEAVPFEQGYRGDALNLAARLCNLAGPGEVLTTEGVVYLGRRVQGVSYSERARLQVKGFADPVRVIRVVRNPERAGIEADEGAERGTEAPAGRDEMVLPIGGFLGALPSGVLVGREMEWERVMSCLERVMQGTGQLVMLAGEPGIGKTRIAQEVTLKARHWGFVVATGRCYQQEQALPYYPFLEALVTLYWACPPDIRAEVPRRWSYLGRLLPEEVGLIPSPRDGQEDQHLLFRAVTGFVEAVAEVVPVALLLDDLHWADDSSLKLLQHLARNTRASRALLLGTYRDVEIHRQHPLDTALLDLSREGLLEEVEIRRLDQDGTMALMSEVLGGNEVLQDLADLLFRRTDGNAFFIQEMLRTLVERGDLYREDGHWARREMRDMEVPKSIRAVIGQRLSRLEEAAQDILREASVLGEEFSFDDLLAMGELAPPIRPSGRPGASDAGWTEDEIEGALEQALVAGLVRETGGDSYAFNHALTQQALYAELTVRRRKRLHLAAGRTLERLPQRDRERRAAELAWHFLEGDDLEKGLDYTLLAGDQAETVFANQEADRHYRTALELARELGDVEREIAVLEKLARVLTIGARFDQALEMLDQAVRLHQGRGNREGEACAVAQMGQIHLLRDTSDEGIARLEPLVELMEQDGCEEKPRYAQAALWAALARLYADVGKYKEELKAAERAVELARAIEDDSLLLGAEVTRTDALWRLDQGDDALSVVEQLIPRAEAAGDLENLVRALGHAAIYYAGRGDFDKDRQYHERVLEVSQRRGDRGQIVLTSMSLMTTTFLIGDWEQARAHLERAESIVRMLGTTRLAIWPAVARAWLSLREGDLEAARRDGEEALSLAQGTSDLVWRRNVERLLAERDILLGNPGAAITRLTSYLEQPGGTRDIGLLSTMAWAWLEEGTVERAPELVEGAVERAAKRNRQADMVEALCVQGMVEARQERWEEATATLTRAVDLARSMPFPFGEARAMRWLGSVAAAQGNRELARERLEEARAIFIQLGAWKDAQLAEEAMDDLRTSAAP